MGCTVSKLDNDDTVQRCKERRHLMREAVYARHHLAAAHFDYCTSLRLTGSALVAFASGEPLPVSDHTPAVLLRTSTPTPTSATKPPTFVPPSHHHSPYTTPSPSVRPPPPPPMSTTLSHHHQKPPPPRRRKPIKLPHILSDSSISSSPPPNHNFTYNARANSTYSSTPSQTSSVWNWDNFYPPPSPPDSEFFHKLHNSKKSETRVPNANSDDDDHHDKASNFTSYSSVRRQNPVGGVETKQFDDGASNYSPYSRYSDNNHVKNQIPKPVLMRKAQNSKQWESSEEEAEREEVQCSEWGDHDNYTYTSSSGDEDDDLKSRSDFRTRSNIGSVKNDGNEKMDANSKFSSISEKLSSEEAEDDDDGKSFANWGNGVNSEGVNSDRRVVVRHRDLSEIVEALNEYFDKAASAGDQVSEILEAGPAQLDRSFKQLRKTIYHSSGMLSNLSSTWTSKPPLAVKYRFEQSSDSKSLCSTLERILAWENKLYQEVKAREGVKLENERKLSALQSQEYRGEDEAKVDKTKASIKRLQSLQLVTSQAVSTTSFAIIGLRDSDLVPQLVELCHGFMYMWRSMNLFHQLQNDIVQQVRGLVGPTTKPTTDLHRQVTRDLESAVATWHSSFCRAIKFHRDFVRSLHGWFKLTLVPVNTESTHAEKSQPSEVFAFLDEWKLVLERAPDTVASEAIKSFNSVVRSISTKQSEELKIKKRAELVSRDLEKRASSLRNIERKYYQSYSMVGVGPASDGVLDGRDPLSEKKAELITWRRRVEDEMNKHSKAVEVTRAMTMNNIQTGLPGVFHALSGFSALITEALDTVCTKSYAI